MVHGSGARDSVPGVMPEAWVRNDQPNAGESVVPGAMGMRLVLSLRLACHPSPEIGLVPGHLGDWFVTRVRFDVY